MGKSPLILAALAKAAVPSLNFSQVKPLSGSQLGHFDSALLTATSGDYFVIRIPSTNAGSLEMDVETQVLKLFTDLVRAKLPFKVTNILGETREKNRKRAVVFEYLFGDLLDFDRLAPTSNLASSVGRAIGAIHSLDAEAFRAAGFPEFSPAETAKRRFADLDTVSALGLVPPVLLARWEQALEDVSLFRYQPTVVHGGLTAETVLEQDQNVSAILNWGALHIGDPAEDLAWIAGAGVPDLLEAVRLAYFQAADSFDSSITQRAALYSELGHALWLLHGKTVGDPEIVDEALAELELLASEVQNGTALDLTAAGFKPTASVAGGFVTASELAETGADVSTESADAESVDTSGAEPTQAGDPTPTAAIPVVQESDEAPDEVIDETKTAPVTVVDDKTREIELPAKTDNELF